MDKANAEALGLNAPPRPFTARLSCPIAARVKKNLLIYIAEKDIVCNASIFLHPRDYQIPQFP